MDDELADAIPRCPSCLARLEVAGTDENPRWRCPECGTPILSP